MAKKRQFYKGKTVRIAEEDWELLRDFAPKNGYTLLGFLGVAIREAVAKRNRQVSTIKTSK